VLHGPIDLRRVPLTGEMLRRECEVQGLDHNGPVRALRQRLVDHFRGAQMDTTAKTEVTQASDSNDLVINADITDPPGNTVLRVAAAPMPRHPC